MAKRKQASGVATSKSTSTFPDADVFDRAIGAIRQTQAEQVLIERAIGQAVIEKMSRKQPNLVDIYAKLGGTDPVVTKVFERISQTVVDLPTDRPVKLSDLGAELKRIINRPGLAAGKSHAVAIGNPLFGYPDTALHTLAELGGDTFKDAYKVPR